MAVMPSYRMKVSSNGQVSIPAEARARWQAREVVVVDLGDRVVMRPVPVDPIGALKGKYKQRSMRTDQARSAERANEMAGRARR